MKKILIIMAVALGLIACQKQENIKFDKTASQGIAGTYTGIWSRTLVGEGNSEVGDGSIVFEATEDPYVARVTVSCAEPAINRSGLVNVSHADHGYVFYNNSTSAEAGFGSAFSGRVYKDGSIDMQYIVEEQVGRFKNKYKFEFSGNKQ